MCEPSRTGSERTVTRKEEKKKMANLTAEVKRLNFLVEHAAIADRADSN